MVDSGRERYGVQRRILHKRFVEKEKKKETMHGGGLNEPLPQHSLRKVEEQQLKNAGHLSMDYT